MSEALALQMQAVTRSFHQGSTTIEVLRGIDLDLGRGEIVALLGPSGSGKSTLLQAAGLLEGGYGGHIRIDGTEAGRLSDAQRTALRREKLGFVYQFHHLLPDFSALENVVLAELVAGRSLAAATTHATALLAKLGLGARLHHRPARLSGGEQQRVAVARALANRPVLILADEPTGNLDEETAARVLEEFLHLVREQGSAALIATHNRQLAARMDRTLRLHLGRLVDGAEAPARSPPAAG